MEVLVVGAGVAGLALSAGGRAVAVHDEGVEVTDEAGRGHAVDVLVGAEGHASIVRRETVDPRPAASQVTNRPPNAAVRALASRVPADLAGRLYLAQVRRWSSVLADERP